MYALNPTQKTALKDYLYYLRDVIAQKTYPNLCYIFDFTQAPDEDFAMRVYYNECLNKSGSGKPWVSIKKNGDVEIQNRYYAPFHFNLYDDTPAHSHFTKPTKGIKEYSYLQSFARIKGFAELAQQYMPKTLPGDEEHTLKTLDDFGFDLYGINNPQGLSIKNAKFFVVENDTDCVHRLHKLGVNPENITVFDSFYRANKFLEQVGNEELLKYNAVLVKYIHYADESIEKKDYNALRERVNSVNHQCIGTFSWHKVFEVNENFDVCQTTANHNAEQCWSEFLKTIRNVMIADNNVKTAAKIHTKTEIDSMLAMPEQFIPTKPKGLKLFLSEKYAKGNMPTLKQFSNITFQKDCSPTKTRISAKNLQNYDIIMLNKIYTHPDSIAPEILRRMSDSKKPLLIVAGLDSAGVEIRFLTYPNGHEQKKFYVCLPKGVNAEEDFLRIVIGEYNSKARELGLLPKNEVWRDEKGAFPLGEELTASYKSLYEAQEKAKKIEEAKKRAKEKYDVDVAKLKSTIRSKPILNSPSDSQMVSSNLSVEDLGHPIRR